MNLSSLPIPRKFIEMQKTYEKYYSTFYLEMIRMSNVNFSSHIEEFIQILSQLSKLPTEKDAVRTAIGVLCLYNLGYPDFTRLTRIFDRVIPQIDTEYVLFTSWCCGKLIHHPNSEQSKYVSRLFERCLGWIRARGRRSRHLAAAHMIETMSLNAGADVVVTYPQLQSAIWTLVSHPSMQLLKATSLAVARVTRATIRYGRSDLDNVMDFFTILCSRLLSLGSPFKDYAAVVIFEQLIRSVPGHFIPHFQQLFNTIHGVMQSSKLLVKSAAFVTLSWFALIDVNQYTTFVIPTLLEHAQYVIAEFPMEISASLVRCIEFAPGHCKSKISIFKGFCSQLISEPNAAFILYSALLKSYDGSVLPINNSEFIVLMEAPITDEYRTFVVAYANVCSNHIGPILSKRLLRELSDCTNEPIIPMQILSQLPRNTFTNNENILCQITSLSGDLSEDLRSVIPRAMYNLGVGYPGLSSSILKRLFQMAIFDRSSMVRVSILNVLGENVDELADPEYTKYLQIFIADTSTAVCKSAFRLVAKLASKNPMMLSAVTREASLDCFFTIQNVPSIRMRSKVVSTFPDLISASKSTIKIYAPTIIKIATHMLSHPPDPSTFSNFLESIAADSLKIGLLEALQLVAEEDNEMMEEISETLINVLCNMILVEKNRKILLHSLKLLYVMLTPPANTRVARSMSPIILSICSQFLGLTHSRKCRMTCLKVIGAIGVLEVRQKERKGVTIPDIVDQSLTREFFHPTRDLIGDIDDTLLMHPATTEQSIVAIVTNSLMDIFNDHTMKELYLECTKALVDVLKSPKMSILAHFDRFLTRFLEILDNASDYELKMYIPLYTTLVEYTNQNISPFLPQSLAFVIKRFNQKVSIPLLDLIIALARATRDHFAVHASETICLLVQVLDSMKCTSDAQCHKVLDAFSVICVYNLDLLHLVIPSITEAIICEQIIPSVRVSALEALEKLVCSIDLFKYIGQICRALEYSLTVPHEGARNASFNLLYSMLLAQGREFLLNADPLITFIKNNNLETSELREIIKSVSNTASYASFTQIKNPYTVNTKAKPPPVQHEFNEEIIIAKTHAPALGVSKHVEQWLHSFILTVINTSPSESIRACSALASTHRPLAIKLFSVAFFTCWKQISDSGRKQIVDTFTSILSSNENYEGTAKEILNVVFFMRKMDPPLTIPTSEIVKACKLYGRDALALLIQQDVIYEKGVTPTSIENLIDIYVNMGQWDNANAAWEHIGPKLQSDRQPETLSKLHMWDKVRPIYSEMFHNNHDTSALPGLAKSLAAMSLWPELMEYNEVFGGLPIAERRSIVPIFANGMILLNRWKELDEALKIAPDDSLRCLSLKAINQIHKGDYDAVTTTIDQAFSVLASRPISLWADKMQIHQMTQLFAQQFIEILEMRDLKRDNSRKDQIESVWKERLKVAPRDFELWFKILGNRVSITGVDSHVFLIDFFQLRSNTLGTQVHMNTFQVLFPGFNFSNSGPLARVCYAVVHWSIGERVKALSYMKELTQSLTGYLLERCKRLYASWILEIGDTLDQFRDAFDILSSTDTLSDRLYDRIRYSKRKISSTTSHLLPKSHFESMNESNDIVSTLRMWADVNMQLMKFDNDNLPEYVTNTILALSKCCILSPAFTDVVQLLNLFFEHANIENVFGRTSQNCIAKLPAKLLLQASPQLLVQLSHKVPSVREYVHKIIFGLLQDHYHELIFSIIVMTYSKDSSRSAAAKNLVREFHKSNRRAAEEVLMIRQCLLMAAVTWYEQVMQRITDAFDHYSLQQFDLMVETLKSITEMRGHAKCEMHVEFLKQYEPNLDSLERILRVFSPHNQNAMSQLTQWCKTMQSLLTEDIKKTRTIQLSSLSHDLSIKTGFQLAVPGTYRPGKQLIRIQYFVGQLSVYMSKQQPKDVVICGEDGVFYQYLVKGHEDLRLDERIMQFFRLINAFLKREIYFANCLIVTMSVIPLSYQHGLVQWVSGTDTIRVVVEQYRRLKSRDPIQEYNLTEKISYGSFDYMMPIQKMQVIQQVMSVVPDSDIANFIYLKAPNAETWMKQTVSFSTSAAMTSIVGYVIGLGDRHPSNLLIDRHTGKLIHIDFGDCFERAAKRKLLPEVVPFRLTRMMVRAMGICGAHGTFKTAFINTSRVLRENRRVLIMVLSIFVHEPLVDPREKRSGSANSSRVQGGVNVADISRKIVGSTIDRGRILLADSSEKQSNTEMRNRINQKLSGTDFGSQEPLSVEDQATLLIQQATDTYNLSKMYSGWCPFW